MEDKNRTESLLVMLLLSNLKGLSMMERAEQLNIAGFSNIEIANYLQTTAQTISQLLYENRKKGKKSSKK